MTNNEQLWAYLHGELATDQREALEQELSENLALQHEFECIQKMHETLKRGLPFVEESETDEELVDRLLAEWEADQAKEQSGSRRLLRVLFQPRVALAAAASLLLALGLSRYSSSPIRWASVRYGEAPSLRSEESILRHYSEKELRQIGSTLKTDIETAYAADSEKRPAWKLELSMQELVEGALAVTLTGRCKTVSSAKKVWTFVWNGSEELTEQMAQSVSVVAGDMTQTSVEY